EVDLCGHATLAAAFVLFTELGFAGETVRFHTRVGELGASLEGARIVLDFPAWPARRCEQVPALLAEALGWLPRELFKTRDFLAAARRTFLRSARRPRRHRRRRRALQPRTARGSVEHLPKIISKSACHPERSAASRSERHGVEGSRGFHERHPS